MMAYGPGSDYTIDTTRSYHVETKFWTYANSTSPEVFEELYSIKTYLSQDGSEVVIEQDCEGYLDGLTGRMADMSMGISSYSVGESNDISAG
jgi:hypothetical protein